MVGYRICSGCPCGQRIEGNGMNHEIFSKRKAQWLLRKNSVSDFTEDLVEVLCKL